MRQRTASVRAFGLASGAFACEQCIDFPLGLHPVVFRCVRIAETTLLGPMVGRFCDHGAALFFGYSRLTLWTLAAFFTVAVTDSFMRFLLPDVVDWSR